MRTLVSLIAGLVFVMLAGLNVWIMMTDRGSKPNGRLWMRVHRTVGYVFITVFVVAAYFMLMRLKGDTGEPPARILLHMTLALMLAPLLFVKVIVARRQPPGSHGLLPALGITIFSLSFTLVAMNVASFLLRNAKSGAIPVVASAALVVVVLAAVGTLLLKRDGAEVTSAAKKTVEPSDDRLNPRAVRPSGKILTLRLSRVEPQTHDSKTLRFVVSSGESFSARPGQFLTFQWTIDGEQVFRSYSICSSPTQTGYIEIVPKRVPNGRVSGYLNDRALPGLVVKAGGPYGRFCFDENEHKRIVLIAGGSGITPIMSMLRYIDDLSIAADVVLIYCVRTRSDVFFKRDLAELAIRMKKFRYVQVLSQPDPDWCGPKGHVTRELIEREVENPASWKIFLCGPPPFMEHVRRLLEDLQVDRAAILQESFGGDANAEEPATADVCRVEFVRAGRACALDPNETILRAAEMSGIPIPYGCRQGRCGTCATRLVSGKVRMEREEGLSEQLRARGYILPCVSRALGNIAIDA